MCTRRGREDKQRVNGPREFACRSDVKAFSSVPIGPNNHCPLSPGVLRVLIMERRILLIVTAVALLIPLAQRADASWTPMNSLAIGRPPTIPYGIGRRLYAYGRVIDLSASFRSLNNPNGQLLRVIGSRGVSWATFLGYGADCIPTIGRETASIPFKIIAESQGACLSTDVSTGGLAATSDEVFTFTSSGRMYAQYPRQNPLKGCGDSGGDYVQAAGYFFLVTESDCGYFQGRYLWYPGSTPQKMPDNYYVLGRLGTGWLGAAVASQTMATCWKIAPVTQPFNLSPTQICSMAKPLVSSDGKQMVVVQGGFVRVVSTATGYETSEPALPAILSGWSPTKRYEVPSAWETSDSFIIDFRYDTVLGLIRCSISTRHCERAIASTYRTGVTDLITERGAADAAASPSPF